MTSKTPKTSSTPNTTKAPNATPSKTTAKSRRAILKAKLAYMHAQYMLAKHSNKVLISLLQRAHPDMPWKNLEFAARHS